MLIGAIGYLAAFTGLLAGAAISCFTKKSGRSILTGFAAGLLIAFAAFDMLPQAFASHGSAAGITLAMMGTLLAAWFDERSRNAGDIFKIGIMLHGIPEGIALGGVLQHNFAAGLSLALIIAIHCLPESLSLFGYMQREGVMRGKILPTVLILAAPMGIGAALGGTLGGVFSNLCLAFAGGIMIYLACEGILPDRRKGYAGTLSALLGFAAGVVITSL